MKRSPLAAFLMAIGLGAVLDRMSGGGRKARRSAQSSSAGAAPRPAAEPRADPSRAIVPLVLFLVGAVSMLFFEATVTRVIGVLALFAFVVSGVFAIADPRWLAGAPELGHPGASDASDRQGGG
jgi:hypothetical protein